MQGGFPGGSMVKNPPVNAGDNGLIPGVGVGAACRLERMRVLLPFFFTYMTFSCWLC